MLDGRAVGNRIGIRHTEFDQVGAGGNQGMHEGDRRLRQRIAGADERNQSLAPGLPEIGKALLDALAHSSMPSRAAIVCTSLSPRPERLHRIS